MAFYCGSRDSHQHSTVEEAKRCSKWGGIFATAAAAPVLTKTVHGLEVAADFEFGSRRFPNGPLSEPQFTYIRDLHGDLNVAIKYSYNSASKYITELLDRKRELDRKKEPEPTVIPEPRQSAAERHKDILQVIDAMIDLVPDGYYAVPVSSSSTALKFCYFSRPKKGKFAGALKFQEHIGSWDTGRYEQRIIRWSSGQWSIYSEPWVEILKGIVTDHKTAAMLYADELKRCCRCNAALTDERSRYYAIGPECEKVMPGVIDEINDQFGPWHFGKERPKVQAH